MKNSLSSMSLILFSMIVSVLSIVACSRTGGKDSVELAMASIRPEAIRADMRFLTDDLLEGRGTATRGHEIAAMFMATQFEQIGLEPAGENGTFFQSVPFRSGRPDEARSELTLRRGGKAEEVVFIRSDQYSFVKQGVPAVFPVPGFKSSNPEINPAEIFKKWETERYHMPGDDMEQPGLLFEEAAKYGRFVFLCGELVADDAERPAWNKGDFFGDRYGKG